MLNQEVANVRLPDNFNSENFDLPRRPNLNIAFTWKILDENNLPVLENLKANTNYCLKLKIELSPSTANRAGAAQEISESILAVIIIPSIAEQRQGALSFDFLSFGTQEQTFEFSLKDSVSSNCIGEVQLFHDAHLCYSDVLGI